MILRDFNVSIILTTLIQVTKENEFNFKNVYFIVENRFIKKKTFKIL